MSEMVERVAEAVQTAANEAAVDVDEYCGLQMAYAAARAAIKTLEEMGWGPERTAL